VKNDVKSFPLRLSAEFHAAIKETAGKEGKSIHQFIIDSLKKKVEMGEK
jgi:predicted HicB family RNase H-like nuclease